jgi:hypothetical protein
MSFPKSPDRLLGHTTSFSLGVMVLSPEVNNCDVTMNMHFHLVPRLRMSGVIPTLTHMYFMVCIT